LILVAAILAVAPLPRQVVERMYSRGVYAVVQPALTGLSNSTDFAWFDALVVVTATAVLALWIARLRKRQGGIAKTLAMLAVDTAAIAAVLYLWFLGAWGSTISVNPFASSSTFAKIGSRRPRCVSSPVERSIR
jgi:hypothetical protein